MSNTIAVIGAGPAGSFCACKLVQLGFQVYLVADQASPPRSRFGEVLGPAGVHMLQRLGLSIPPECGELLDSFESIWEVPSVKSHSFSFWSAECARMLFRPRFDEWLREEALKLGVQLVDRSIFLETGWGWVIDGNRSVSVDYVVEATGRNARSYCYDDITRIYVDSLVMQAAEFVSTAGGVSQAVVEAVPEGWLYFAQSQNGTSFIGVACDSDFSSRVCTEPLETIRAQLEHTVYLRDRVPIDGILQQKTYDSRTSYRSTFWRDRWIAVGDALWTIDPLAGIGIEKALMSSNEAANALYESTRSDSALPLRTYSKQQNTLLQIALAQRQKVYSSQHRFRDKIFWRRRAALG